MNAFFKSKSYRQLRPQHEIPDNSLLPPLPSLPLTTSPFSVGSNIVVVVFVDIDAKSAPYVMDLEVNLSEHIKRLLNSY